MYYEYNAFAIGSRCQTANTYLENNLDLFQDSSLEDLINHAVAAMKKAQDVKLTCKNLDIGYVGEDSVFTRLSEEKISSYLEARMIIDG